MKVLAAILLLGVSSLGYTAENSSINDLQYLPNAGTFFGTSSLNYFKASGESFNGTTDIRSRTSGPIFVQSLGYSLMNIFSLEAVLSYSDVESKTTGTSATKSSGLGDLGLLGRYRLLDSENRFDLLANLSLSPGKNELKANGDSNGYTGGHSIGLGAEYGLKKGGLQWSFSGNLTHNLESKTEDKSTGGVDYKDEAYNELSFAANLLTQIAEKNFFKFSLGANFSEEYEDDEGGTTYGNSSYGVSGEFQHLFSVNFVVRAGARASLDGDGSGSSSMVYDLAATYQF